VEHAKCGTHGWFMIKRLEMLGRYDRPQPARHTFYVLLNLHVRVLRVRIKDCHKDLILRRRGCFGPLRHGRVLILWAGTGGKLIEAGFKRSPLFRARRALLFVSRGRLLFEGTVE
jgi:hypothetical protein